MKLKKLLIMLVAIVPTAIVPTAIVPIAIVPIAIVPMILLQSGCSIVSGVASKVSNIVGGDDDEEETFAALESITQEIKLQRLWSIKVGNGQGDKYNRLSLAIDGDRIFAGAQSGLVLGLNRHNGKSHWRTKLKQPVSGGVGASHGLVLLGTEKAQVFALEQAGGSVRWVADVSSEVLSAPQTNGDIVVVQTVDGKLIALDADSGEQRWIYESSVPVLTLRGTSTPIIADDIVLAGFANGTLVAVAAENGILRWEQRVAVPSGRSELERIIDIDGELLKMGEVVLTTSYQGHLVGFDINSGRSVWRVKSSSYLGADEGFGNVYVSNDRSHVRALRNGSCEVVWENTSLNLRNITAPTTIGNYVAVGDFEGYLHLLSQVDGHFVARSKVDGKGLRSSLLADDDTLYVLGNSGKLVAFSIP